MAENVYDWSPTAATNASADSAINFAEGQTAGSFNDSCRSVMAAVAKWLACLNGSITSAGTANAQTLTSGITLASYPTNFVVRWKVGAALTNTASATLNIDSLGAKTLKNAYGNALVGGELVAGFYAEAIYNGTDLILVSGPGVSGAVIKVGGASLTLASALNITGLPSNMSKLEVNLNNLLPATNATDLWMRVSNDGGSTYISTASYNYARGLFGGVSSTGAGITPQAAVGASDTKLILAASLNSAAAQYANFNITMMTPKAGAGGFVASGFYVHSTGVYYAVKFGGQTPGVGAINAVRFLMSSGNIAASGAYSAHVTLE